MLFRGFQDFAVISSCSFYPSLLVALLRPAKLAVSRLRLCLSAYSAVSSYSTCGKSNPTNCRPSDRSCVRSFSRRLKAWLSWLNCASHDDTTRVVTWLPAICIAPVSRSTFCHLAMISQFGPLTIWRETSTLKWDVLCYLSDSCVERNRYLF